MMNEAIFKAIENEFGEEYDVKENNVTKNNGVVKPGVSISEKGSNVGICVYLDGITTEEEAIRVVRASIKEGIDNSRKLRREIDPKVLFSRDSLLKKVYPVIVNREKNVNSNVIKSRFYDLDVIYKIDVDMGDGIGCITLTKETLQFSDVGIATLHRQAIENIKNKGVIMDIEQKLISLITGEEIENPKTGIMNIVTTKDFKFGAAMLLDEEIVNKLSFLYEGEFYVLPSSIHEVITVPNMDDDADDLIELVRTVNKQEVSDTDFLSNNVYHYHDGKFEVVS